MSVAEIGAGAGDLILEVSELIGAEGHAYLIEPRPERTAPLRDRIRALRNVELIESPYQATPLPSNWCDRVLMANVWRDFPEPLAVLREAGRVLKDDGRLVLVEWHAEAQCPDAPEKRVGLRDMVRLLETEVWDIHGHGDLGAHCYFLEAGVSDESVQS